MTDPQHILIIRPSALGDVCRTVPVLASLRRAYPKARIEWIVQEEFIPAVAHHPDLNGAIGFPRSRLAGWWKGPGRFMEMTRWFGGLRRSGFDLVLDCQGLGRSGLMALASGAGRRVGLRRARELAWVMYNRRVRPSAADQSRLHTVDEMLLLVQSLGIPLIHDMRLYASQADQAWWQAQREELGMAGEPYVVLAPTARWASKRWPIERFAQLIEPLHQRGFSKVVVIGSPGETEQVHEIFRRFPPCRLGATREESVKSFVLDLVGSTSIGQTMAVIADAGLVIANDSAPLHMAVGFNRPCVALFGPTDPAIVGPYGAMDSVIRGYMPRSGQTIDFKDSRLGDRLMRFISTTAVVQRIDRVMSRAPAGEIVTPRQAQAAIAKKSQQLPDDLQHGVAEGAAS